MSRGTSTSMRWAGIGPPRWPRRPQGPVCRTARHSGSRRQVQSRAGGPDRRDGEPCHQAGADQRRCEHASRQGAASSRRRGRVLRPSRLRRLKRLVWLLGDGHLRVPRSALHSDARQSVSRDSGCRSFLGFTRRRLAIQPDVDVVRFLATRGIFLDAAQSLRRCRLGHRHHRRPRLRRADLSLRPPVAMPPGSPSARATASTPVSSPDNGNRLRAGS